MGDGVLLCARSWPQPTGSCAGFWRSVTRFEDPTFSLSEGLLGIIIPLLEGAEWIAGVHAAAKFGVPLAEKWSAALEPIHEWRDEVKTRIGGTATDRAEALHLVQQCVEALNNVRDEANRLIEENKDAGLRGARRVARRLE